MNGFTNECKRVRTSVNALRRPCLFTRYNILDKLRYSCSCNMEIEIGIFFISKESNILIEIEDIKFDDDF